MYSRRYAREIQELLRARYEAWHVLAARGEVRWLIDRRGHEEYYSAALRTRFMTETEVRAQIEEAIRLIDAYRGLEVAMQETRIPTTFSIYGSRTVTIYGQVFPPESSPSLHGIRAVVSEEPTIVTGFRASFEADWRRWFTPTSRSRVRRWLATLEERTRSGEAGPL
jgi:hypothetical protein